jgi:hypothetical protein
VQIPRDRVVAVRCRKRELAPPDRVLVVTSRPLDPDTAEDVVIEVLGRAAVGAADGDVVEQAGTMTRADKRVKYR